MLPRKLFPSRFLPCLVIALTMLAVVALPGCDAIKQTKATTAQLEQMSRQRDALASQAAQVDAAKTAADAQAATVAGRQSIIRQSIAQVSQQLASAQGPAFDALLTTQAALQSQLKAAGDQGEIANAQAAQAASLAAKLNAQIKSTDAALAQGQAKLASLQSSLTDQANGVGGMIRQVGDAVQNYGIPGAVPAANTVAGLWTGLAGLLLGGLGVAGVAKKKLAGANQTAANATTAASEIAESIQLARNNIPGFDAALQSASGVLSGYQGNAAQAVVKAAKASIPTIIAAPPVTPATR